MQKLRLSIIVVMIIGLGIVVNSCVEPFEVETTEFKSALVVEATITNNNETQRVLVSRTFPLDTVLMSGVSGAQVAVTDSNGGVYNFTETSEGVYESSNPFGAVSGLTYSLSIQSDGNNYISDEMEVPAVNPIERVYAERDFKDNGAEEGMFIYVDSYDPTGQSKYYRYEYEETYKIIAPYWSSADAYVVSPLPNPEVDVRARTQEEQVCYRTETSTGIIMENTTEYSEDRVSKFPVRFINRANYILSHRYSILVRQFVQSRAAYAYYETLETLSGSESLFSQIQAGFLEGNIRSQTDEEDVVGFFQVSTVSEERIFFDYEDFFPGEDLPSYVSDCPLLAPALLTEGGSSPLIDGIEQNLIKYYSEYSQQDDLLFTDGPGPYFMVYRVCSDCTVLGENVVPDFWVE
ncbi:DUF4249 domain-containing protein [Maribacter sp. MMG018]|uniref:DUF4249 domain-containing protein n=1 Tax=Maribacter sp. MMG018 TaxID=2822688 RepID=UPI001B36E5EE|nr:DUF4249 domain-containing protein [Maribacter sp. MMG018]MBQ4915411.1 DUF4249 domain-containing protein [Maribacter sp. MMG018]